MKSFKFFYVIFALIIGMPIMAESTGISEHIKNVTAISEVFGDGQKLSAVAVEYDAEINSSKLKPTDFKVEGKVITKIYANSKAEKSKTGVNGKYVIIELENIINNNEVFGQMGGNSENKQSGPPAGGGPKLGSKRTVQPEIKIIEAIVTQTGTIMTTKNKKYQAIGKSLKSTKTINLVVDDFKQLVFTDAKYNNKKLMYNLFIPKNYDPKKKYPLVVFMHDAGAVADVPNYTLIQGNGATSWASAEAQAKNECFVLAPQFDCVIADDSSVTTEDMDVAVDLIKELPKEYSIDTNRIYNTGQSMGGMTSIAMNIKYPEVFAASLLVACQWDSTKVAPLANKNLWIVVSEGDNKASPGMDAITNELKKYGKTVSKATWNAETSLEELNKNALDLMSKNTNINYTTFKGGSHRYTWQYAYSIDEIHNWLFKQVKK